MKTSTTASLVFGSLVTTVILGLLGQANVGTVFVLIIFVTIDLANRTMKALRELK